MVLGRFDKLQLREFQSEGENSAFSGQKIRLQPEKPNIQEKKTVEIVLLKHCGGGLDACANAFYSYGKDPFTQLVDRISECNDRNVKNINLERAGSDYLYVSVKTTKDFWHHATDKPAKLIFKYPVPPLTDWWGSSCIYFQPKRHRMMS